MPDYLGVPATHLSGRLAGAGGGGAGADRHPVSGSGQTRPKNMLPGASGSLDR